MNIIQSIDESIKDKLDFERLLFYANIKVERHFTKKNSRPIYRRGGKPFLGKDPAFAKAENAMVQELRLQASNSRITQPFEDDVWAMFLFHFDNYYVKDGSRRSKRIGDLSNLYQMPEDCLQKAGIIKDDSQICSHDLSRRIPSSETYLEVFLLKLD